MYLFCVLTVQKCPPLQLRRAIINVGLRERLHEPGKVSFTDYKQHYVNLVNKRDVCAKERQITKQNCPRCRRSLSLLAMFV